MEEKTEEKKPVYPFVSQVKQLVSIFIFARSSDRDIARRAVAKMPRTPERAERVQLLDFVNHHFHIERYYKTAITNFRHLYLEYSFEELLHDCWKWMGEHVDDSFISLEDSYNLIVDWIEFHKFEEDTFIKDMYNVLAGKSGKHNTMFIQGVPNGGKTMVFSQPLEILMGTVGRIVNINTGDRFVFENCVNQRLISIEECAIPPQHIEEMKKLMSGEHLQVDVKNQREGSAILKTPVICSSNSEPWSLDIGAKDALLARMYYYTTSRPFPTLAEYVGLKVDPRAWIVILVNYHLKNDLYEKFPILKKNTEDFMNKF